MITRVQTIWRVAAVTTLAVLALTGLQLALPRGALADTYERGVAALDAGRYDEALFHISLLAANDDPRAQYTMGVMYRRGLGVVQDDREALLWYLSAAEAGHMLGQYAAGLAFDRGIGTDRDIANALHYLGEAALQGHAAAPVQIGNIHYLGKDTGVDHARAYFWWQIGVNRNAPGATQNMFRLKQEISDQDLIRAEGYLTTCQTKTLRQCRP